MRSLEVFATDRLPVDADEVGYGAIGIECDRYSATPEQEAADSAGARDVVRHVGAIDHLHRRQADPADAHRLQDERKGAAVVRAAYQAEAIVGRVTCKQRDVGFG